jgi:ferredoxin
MMTEEKKVLKMEDVKAMAEEKKCTVQQALSFVEIFLDGPMCGRCFPCSMGSYEARIRLKKLVSGVASEEDLAVVKMIAATMAEASMCKKGKDTAKFILDNIDSEEFTGHITGVCATNQCAAYAKYIIVPEACTMCGDCLAACKDHAIIGEKAKPWASGIHPFEIVQKRCTQCGECLKICPDNAVRCLSVKDFAEKEAVGV